MSIVIKLPRWLLLASEKICLLVRCIDGPQETYLAEGLAWVPASAIKSSLPMTISMFNTYRSTITLKINREKRIDSPSSCIPTDSRKDLDVQLEGGLPLLLHQFHNFIILILTSVRKTGPFSVQERLGYRPNICKSFGWACIVLHILTTSWQS